MLEGTLDRQLELVVYRRTSRSKSKRSSRSLEFFHHVYHRRTRSRRGNRSWDFASDAADPLAVVVRTRRSRCVGETRKPHTDWRIQNQRRIILSLRASTQES